MTFYSEWCSWKFQVGTQNFLTGHYESVKTVYCHDTAYWNFPTGTHNFLSGNRESVEIVYYYDRETFYSKQCSWNFPAGTHNLFL